jgi:hypothetical protein
MARIDAMVGEHDAAIDQLESLLSVPSPTAVPMLRIDPAWDQKPAMGVWSPTNDPATADLPPPPRFASPAGHPGARIWHCLGGRESKRHVCPVKRGEVRSSDRGRGEPVRALCRLQSPGRHGALYGARRWVPSDAAPAHPFAV